ncbi:MAG: OB-fold domain-containing protein [Flavobacteriaceae bacterium]
MDLTEVSGEATLLFATHNITPACHPRFEKIAPYVYGHLKLKEGPIVQAIILGVDATPDALKSLFERGPLKARAETLKMDDLPVIAFRIVDA